GRGGAARTSTAAAAGFASSDSQTRRSSGVKAMPWPGVPDGPTGIDAITWPVVTLASSKPLNPTTSLTISVPRPLTENGASTPPQQYPVMVATTRLAAALAT